MFITEEMLTSFSLSRKVSVCEHQKRWQFPLAIVGSADIPKCQDDTFYFIKYFGILLFQEGISVDIGLVEIFSLKNKTKAGAF